VNNILFTSLAFSFSFLEFRLEFRLTLWCSRRALDGEAGQFEGKITITSKASPPGTKRDWE
jgi:hypothetical protein